MKINPYFEVKGKTYEIKRTRYLETEYDRITSSSKLSAEQESLFADYIKLESEYNEIIEKFKNAKDDYFATDNDSHNITWLVPNSQKNAMEPIIIELKPGCVLTKDMPHEGQEFGYVLKGKVVVVVGNKPYKVKSGETFYYDTNKVHYIKKLVNFWKIADLFEFFR